MLIASLFIALIGGWQLLVAHDEDGQGIGVGGNGQPGNQTLVAMSFTPCTNGFAFTFPCRDIDLASFLPLANIGGGTGNDIWGWTDPLTGKEYALLGRSSGTSFVDITDSENPVYLGNLPKHSVDSIWRGLKVYQNHVFIVSEAHGHGMQIFDLTQLRSVVSPPVTFSETAHYAGFERAHTLEINQETGFAYAVGTRESCGGGMHMINIQNPTAPVFAGCVAEDGYVHETQCVIYHGSDAAYVGREICFNANEDTVTIVDVTNKSAPVQLSRTTYLGRGYTHQGWLTDDHDHFLLNDELDERDLHVPSRTRIFNVSNLDAPILTGLYDGPSTAIDHNNYVRGRYVFQANYRSGLRVLDTRNVAIPSLNEVGFFDVYPNDDAAAFNGSWSNYPFFPSGHIIVGGIEQGLFVLRPKVAYLNLIEGAGSFIRQQYADFLGRNPDPGGLGYWIRQITDCGANELCIHHRRIDVSAAFFVENEFQRTGSFIIRIYKGSLGRQPDYLEFSADRDLIVEGPNVEATKDAFANSWVTRPAFTQIYPASLTNEAYVNKLFDTAGLIPFTAERQQQINAMAAPTNRTRAEVLREVIEIYEFTTREYNPSFVLMEYFGYLRRNPDQGGYDFWLNVLNNREPGNYRGMVCSFITSAEYQKRFGPSISRTNVDCSQ